MVDATSTEHFQRCIARTSGLSLPAVDSAMRRTVLIAGMLFHALGIFTFAEESILPATGWPHVRGPRYDGHADTTELVDGFSAAGPPVLWARALGIGYSSLVCDQHQVYTQYQTWGGQYLVCLDALSGREVWSYRYEGPYDPAGLYPGPRATPALALGKVYFAAPSGLVGCVDAASGSPLWTVDLPARFSVAPVEFGYSCSPTIVGNFVLFPAGAPGASMVALDTETGRTVWQSGDDPISHVPALPIRWHVQQLVIGYLRNALVAYRPDDGQVAWRLPLSSDYDEHAAWPIYRQPHLWISAPFRSGSQLLELTNQPPGIRSVWKSKLLSNDVCSSILVGEHLYGFDIRDIQSKLQRPSRGVFRCLNFATGEECWANGTLERTEWNPDSESAASPGKVESTSIGQASVLFADSKLIMLNDTGELILAAADPQQYRELGRVRILGGEICWTPPALAFGRLYARNHSRVVCILLGKQTSDALPQAQLTTADLPQTAFRDWSALILAVEPRYAMDLPSRELIWLWYKVSLAGLCVASLLAVCAISAQKWVVKRHVSARQFAQTIEQSNSIAAGRPFWIVLWALAFMFGALGTTLLSAWLRHFVFTWPVCLFVAFHVVVGRTRHRADGPSAKRWADCLLLLTFLAICYLYYWLCRRLGLGFEWVFLTGYVAAVPFLWAARRRSKTGWPARVAHGLLLTIAFTAYFWMSVAVLGWKYRA